MTVLPTPAPAGFAVGPADPPRQANPYGSWLELAPVRASIVEQTLEDHVPQRPQMPAILSHLDPQAANAVAASQNIGAHRQNMMERRSQAPVQRSVVHWPQQQIGLGIISEVMLTNGAGAGAFPGGAAPGYDPGASQSVQAKHAATTTDSRQRQRQRLRD